MKRVKNASKALLVLLLCACHGGDRSDERAAASAPKSTAPRISEGQVIGAVLASTEAMAAADTAALGIIEQPGVYRYAEILRADHRAIQAEVQAVSDSMHAPGLRDERGDALQKEAAAVLDMLHDSTQTNHTVAYVDGEIALHRHLLGALDSVLLPSATTPMLRQLLTDLRPAFLAHLQRAEQLQQMLANATTTAPRRTATVPPDTTHRTADSLRIRPDTLHRPDTLQRPDTLLHPDTLQDLDSSQPPDTLRTGTPPQSPRP